MDFFSKFRFFSVFFIHMNHSTLKNTKKSVVLKKVLIHSKSPLIKMLKVIALSIIHAKAKLSPEAELLLSELLLFVFLH